MTVLAGAERAPHADAQLAAFERREYLAFGAAIGLMLFVGAVAWTTAPSAFSIAFLLLILTCVVALVRPTYALYGVVFFALIGDDSTTPWWPALKNMSSRESLMFLSDSLSINPVEVVLAFMIFSFVLRRATDPSWRLLRGTLFWPVMVFTGFVTLGFLYGAATGGDRRVAIFEARPIFYIALFYVLTTNLLTTRRQYERLLCTAFVAIGIQSLFALSYYRSLPEAQRELLESLAEHAATVHMNALFLFWLALVLLKNARWRRWSFAVLLPPVVYAYLLSQRRAAMVAFVAGIVLLLAVLFRRRRTTFWVFTPIFAILSTGFVLATWNAQGAIGLPAQAVKSVVAPDQLGTAEQSSDLYRMIESFNLWFTIRQSPLTGLGFGHKFLMPLTLPDISFFEFWEYLPHNAILWIWIKLGYFGFVAMLFMIGRACMAGAASTVKAEREYEAAIVVAALGYVLMFMIFAYVDIAWGGRSTLFLGLTFAICADYLRLPGAPTPPDPVPPRAQRHLPAVVGA
jgi:hypothetical protein